MADSSNSPQAPRSPRIPRHAAQMLPQELTPERKTAVKVPRHATQVLPDLLLHAKEELLDDDSTSSPVPMESNFVCFEKHLLANHIGSLGDSMIYRKETHHKEAEEDAAATTQATPQTGPRPKLTKESMEDNKSGSFDMMAECFYADH